MSGLWPERVWREVRRETAELGVILARKRVREAFEDLVGYLERKYRPDQPRAPKGTQGHA